MTNKMIDADALIDWLRINTDIHCDDVIMAYKDIVKKINELATPKAKFKVGDRVHVMCRDGSILFNSVLIKEILYPPHDYTGKDSIYYIVEYYNGVTEEWREDKIKSLHSTPAPEQQESIFEEIPEIEGILEYYYKPEKTYHVNFQCSVLFGYGMTKEEAEKKRDEWNARKDYEPPAGVFEDDSYFPELHLEQYDDEFKLLLRDYIKRKNAKQQQSIKNADK